MSRISPWQIAGFSLLALATVAYLTLPAHLGSWPWLTAMDATPRTAVSPPVSPPPRALEPAAPPAIVHPIEAPPSLERQAIPLPALRDSDGAVKDTLIDLFGRKSVLSLLNLDAFLRGVVATVDNLARDQAPSGVWPVMPSPGRLLVLERGDGTYIADGNSERYTPFVALATSVDTERTVALYRRFYPLLQQAYEELGYPGQYFNDRLVAVIDHLLATPDAAGPTRVTLMPVRGPYPDTRPWVRYEFADSTLESRSAGQKILLRIGNANARLLKAKLQAFRQRIATRP